jgi:hypothetical protein
MSCHISKFANMAELFIRREQREFRGMREESYHRHTSPTQLSNFQSVR